MDGKPPKLLRCFQDQVEEAEGGKATRPTDEERGYTKIILLVERVEFRQPSTERAAAAADADAAKLCSAGRGGGDKAERSDT